MTGGSSDHTIKIYQRYAREWDADRNGAGWNDEHWHDRFARLLQPGATVLDLGCGSGVPVARKLVQQEFRVTGVDTSPDMIALCRERMPNQEWIVGDMRNVSLDRKFDGILAWDSYFFLESEDQRRMFAVFASHAADGCGLMFNTGPAHGEATGSYRGEPLYHASLDPVEYRSLLDRGGFDLLEHVVEDARAGGRTVWLARARSKQRE
jgi:SAM-dependent methyltransferase